MMAFPMQSVKMLIQQPLHEKRPFAAASRRASQASRLAVGAIAISLSLIGCRQFTRDSAKVQIEQRLLTENSPSAGASIPTLRRSLSLPA